MKIVLWIGDQPNHIALANKIHHDFIISAIIIEKKKPNKRKKLKDLFLKAVEKVTMPSIDSAWIHIMDYYAELFPFPPPMHILRTNDINTQASFDFTLKFQPDLIVVSGTSLIRDKLLSLTPTIGIVNLHTGLSPYVKGGPNCTNWCIANNSFHYIGNTIMWIGKGIDSGNILTTEHTTFNGKESFAEVHMKVMEHAHSLYLKALHYLKAGGSKSVSQADLHLGVTYYSKQWTFWKKCQLIKNFPSFRRRYERGEIDKMRTEVLTVGL